MEYQKIINLLDNTPNNHLNLRQKIGSNNDELRGIYNKNNQI